MPTSTNLELTKFDEMLSLINIKPKVNFADNQISDSISINHLGFFKNITSTLMNAKDLQELIRKECQNILLEVGKNKQPINYTDILMNGALALIDSIKSEVDFTYNQMSDSISMSCAVFFKNMQILVHNLYKKGCLIKHAPDLFTIKDSGVKLLQSKQCFSGDNNRLPSKFVILPSLKRLVDLRISEFMVAVTLSWFMQKNVEKGLSLPLAIKYESSIFRIFHFFIQTLLNSDSFQSQINKSLISKEQAVVEIMITSFSGMVSLFNKRKMKVQFNKENDNVFLFDESFYIFLRERMRFILEDKQIPIPIWLAEFIGIDYEKLPDFLPNSARVYTPQTRSAKKR